MNMKNNLGVRDVHPDGVAEEFDRLMLLDIADLLQSKDQFVDTACPACHGIDVVKSFEYQGLPYRRCHSCEMLYISPAPTEALHLDFVLRSRAMAFWRERLPETMKTTRRPMYQERVAYAQAVWQRLGHEPLKTLELGAGNGEFAVELSLSTNIERIVLLEPQELNLNLPNVEIITGGFEALEHSDESFDTVFAWELIEHLLNPDQFLRQVRQVMKPGATFIMSTPNERSVETRKLGTHSSNILFDHVRLYNPIAIAALLKRNGFRIIELSTPGLLDTDRLQRFFDEHPDAFKDDATLRLALADATTSKNFQTFLRENQLSSHMRVVAEIDGEWQGSDVPLLSK